MAVTPLPDNLRHEVSELTVVYVPQLSAMGGTVIEPEVQSTLPQRSRQEIVQLQSQDTVIKTVSQLVKTGLKLHGVKWQK